MARMNGGGTRMAPRAASRRGPVRGPVGGRSRGAAPSLASPVRGAVVAHGHSAGAGRDEIQSGVEAAALHRLPPSSAVPAASQLGARAASVAPRQARDPRAKPALGSARFSVIACGCSSSPLSHSLPLPFSVPSVSFVFFVVGRCRSRLFVVSASGPIREGPPEERAQRCRYVAAAENGRQRPGRGGDERHGVRLVEPAVG